MHVVLALKSLFCSPECSRPYSSLLLRCLGPWINHLPPIFSSAFWKYKLTQKQTVALYACKREERALVMINLIYIITHWGRVTHLCVSKLTSIASDNGLWPGRRQAIIWNNVGILFIGPLGTNFNFNRNSIIFIVENMFENVVCEMSAILSRPQCVNAQMPYFISQVVLICSLDSFNTEWFVGQPCLSCSVVLWS